MRIRAQGLGVGVKGSGVRVKGSELSVQDSSGFMVELFKGLGFGVWGLGLRPCTCSQLEAPWCTPLTWGGVNHYHSHCTVSSGNILCFGVQSEIRRCDWLDDSRFLHKLSLSY